MKPLSRCLLCCLLWPVLWSWAQERETGLWVNYSLKIPISDRLTYGGDAGYRHFLTGTDWKQVLIRPTLTYSFNETFALAGAVSFFNTDQEDAPNLDEYRIHQDFNVRWPDFGLIRLFFRTRLEQRFFFYDRLPDDFDLRSRFLGGAQTRDLTFLGEKQPIYFKAIFEGFVTLNADKASEFLIDDTRAHLAFGHRLSRAWRYEVHLIWQRSRLGTDGGLRVSQNIFRLRLFHTLFQSKQDTPEVVDPEIE